MKECKLKVVSTWLVFLFLFFLFENIVKLWKKAKDVKKRRKRKAWHDLGKKKSLIQTIGLWYINFFMPLGVEVEMWKEEMGKRCTRGDWHSVAIEEHLPPLMTSYFLPFREAFASICTYKANVMANIHVSYCKNLTICFNVVTRHLWSHNVVVGISKE
jgi:hypothetical protein